MTWCGVRRLLSGNFHYKRDCIHIHLYDSPQSKLRRAVPFYCFLCYLWIILTVTEQLLNKRNGWLHWWFINVLKIKIIYIQYAITLFNKKILYRQTTNLVKIFVLSVDAKNKYFVTILFVHYSWTRKRQRHLRNKTLFDIKKTTDTIKITNSFRDGSLISVLSKRMSIRLRGIEKCFECIY